MKTTAEIVENARRAGLEHHFEPDAQQHRLYAAWFERYRLLWLLMREHLRGLIAPVE